MRRSCSSEHMLIAMRRARRTTESAVAAPAPGKQQQHTTAAPPPVRITAVATGRYTAPAAAAPAQQPRQPTAAAAQALPLSTVLRQHPQLFDRQKISVVEKFITHVDLLPTRYHQAQVRQPYPSQRGSERPPQGVHAGTLPSQGDRAA